MSQYLLDHAKSHVWVDPATNRHLRLKPARLTPLMGSFKTVKVMWQTLPLPNYSDTTQSTYHVYGLGRYNVSDFGLSLNNNTWVGVDTLQQSQSTLIDLIADNGCLIPPQSAYLYYLDGQYLLLAIQREGQDLGSDQIVDTYQQKLTTRYSLDYHGITVRFYRNPLVDNSQYQKGISQPLSVISRVISNAADMTSFLTAVDALVNTYNNVGNGCYYRDGFMVSRPVGFLTDDAGRRYTYRYDDTIKDIRSFNIASCPAFTSTLDAGVDKYLLMSTTEHGQIEYVDDCDFYVGYTDTNGAFHGVSLNNFQGTQIRQVTHNAWSVSQNAVNLATINHPTLANREALNFLVVVRQNPFYRGLSEDVNRIGDLYHLPISERINAMTGVNALVPEWTAAHLEASPYITLMGGQSNQLTSVLAENAYGYSAMTDAIGKSIYPVVNGEITVDPAYLSPVDIYNPNGQYDQSARAIFWYDNQGVLLGYSNDTSVSTTISPPSKYAQAALAEVFFGQTQLGVTDNGTTTDATKVNDPYYGYYGYRTYVNSGSANIWSDVTDTNHYQYVRPTDGSTPYIQWDSNWLSTNGYTPAVRIASTVNVYTPQYAMNGFSGVYSHPLVRLNQGMIRGMDVPPGMVDVFVNGYSLIAGLDYQYTRDGQVFILYCPTTTPDNTQILIRGTGYLNPQTTMPWQPDDIGFVKGGVLSQNGKYNLSDGRESKVIVGGRLYLRSQVITSETTTDNATGSTILDGHPYAVSQPMTLIEPVSQTQNTVDFKLTGMSRDQTIEGYLSQYLNNDDTSSAEITQSRHRLYSPIMSRFIGLCLTGVLSDTVIRQVNAKSSIVTDYKWVSDLYRGIDPVLTGVDTNYVDILPHPYPEMVTVSQLQYTFLNQVNRVFLGSALNLSNYLQIQTGS